MTKSDIRPSKPYPLGATFCHKGVNFSVYSKNGKRVELLFFDAVEDGKPSRIVELNPQRNRTFHYWHACVEGIQPGQLYGYRIHGPYDPQNGHRFDGEKLLIDPYGRAVAVPENYDRNAASNPGDNTAMAMKSVVTDLRAYDWEGDRPLGRPLNQTVIYEMHVAGFTRHPNSGVPAQKLYPT